MGTMAAAARDDVDRLSRLPEDILHRILSLLDTREAVQSSKLSRTYRHLWASVPALSFHNSPFKTLTSFRLFIDKVISRRNSSVNITNFSFALNFTGKCLAKDKNILEKATSYAIDRNARNFDISFDRGDCRLDNRFVANLLSRSSSMENLKLESPFELYDSLCFNQLISLELTLVSFVVFDPFSSCPNLETVILRKCRLTILEVSAARLSRLSILNCSYSGKGNVVLKTPRLKFFECENVNPLLFKADLPNLEFASICLSICTWDDSYDKKEELGLDVINMLRCIRNAKSVTLSVSIAELLLMVPDILEQEHSPLHDLKLLKFIGYGEDKAFDEIPREVIDYLLENSPQAETVADLFSHGKLQCS